MIATPSMRKSTIAVALYVILYTFAITMALYFLLVKYTADIQNIIMTKFYDVKFKADLLSATILFTQGTTVTNFDPNIYFSHDIDVTSLGSAYSCNGKTISSALVVDKLALNSYYDSRLFTTLLGNPDENFIFRVFDGIDGKTFYYDYVGNVLNYDGNGIKLSNDKIEMAGLPNDRPVYP